MIHDDTLLISIDLETLSKQRPNAAIATCGALALHLGTADITGRYYARVERASALELGIADQETLDWWAKQPAAARHEIEGGHRIPLRQALTELLDDIHRWNAGCAAKDIRYVARAHTFDLDILDWHFAQLGLSTPWLYWQERDHRSLEDAYRDALALRGIDAPSYHDWAPPSHHALRDAFSQAHYLANLRQQLRG